MSKYVRGEKRWDKWIESISEDVKEEVKEEVRDTALKIEKDAKRRAPVDTGNLRRQIRSDIDGYNATISSNADYSAYIEYGTYKMSAQPYMTPAFMKYRAEFERDLASILRKAGE